jgi:hypothetical protein
MQARIFQVAEDLRISDRRQVGILDSGHCEAPLTQGTAADLTKCGIAAIYGSSTCFDRPDIVAPCRPSVKQ